MTTAKPKTLKKQLRAILMEMFNMREDHYSNLWFFWSHKTGRDWCVASDAEFIHALVLEGSPDVGTFDLQPAPILAATVDGDGMSKLDAIVRLRSGVVEGREIKVTNEIKPGSREERQYEVQVAASQRVGMIYRRITLPELLEQQLLWCNWFRVLGFLAAVRGREMREYKDRVVLRLAQFTAPVTLDEALHGASLEDEPLYRAALFMLIQEGVYGSNLATAPLSHETLVLPLGGAQ